MNPIEFQNLILAWFEASGRKNLPWQVDPTPYRVWVSEIMLQQTQVSTVIPYYLRFMAQFPSVEALATAPVDTVLHYWSGLGYYARARNLHQAAKLLRKTTNIPSDLDQLMALPGIGRSTAGAILSIAFNKRAAILDGNVKRVLSRFKLIEGWPGNSKVARELWRLSEQYTPKTRAPEYTQSIMDLGATICTRTNPSCHLCPVADGCEAFLQKKISEIPMPRPRKSILVRKCFFLVVCKPGNYFMLENRASSGRWGGLWSFPEFDEKKDILEWCVSNNIDESQLDWLAECRHTFSHFHLDYTPVLAKQSKPSNYLMEDNQRVWYNPINDNHIGLPTPVSRLLEQLSN